LRREAALLLHEKVEADAGFIAAFAPELDIVIFIPRAASVGEASIKSRNIFDAAARRGLHLAVAELPVNFWVANLGGMKRDRETVSCLRSVLMKPEHLDWVERIWEILSAVAAEA
jgi:tyrosine decarboxylase/aspartate 1-decarboxylase